MMRKYIIGALVGAALMFGVQAGASGILSGSKVAGTKEVTYNGKSIGQAAIINNSSYLPVRAVADATGLQIDLGGGKINLSSQQVEEPEESPTSSPAPSPEDQSDVQKQIDAIQDRIKYIDANIIFYQDSARQAREKGYEDSAAEFDAEAAQLQQQKSDLEAQLQALQNQ